MNSEAPNPTVYGHTVTFEIEVDVDEIDPNLAEDEARDYIMRFGVEPWLVSVKPIFENPDED